MSQRSTSSSVTTNPGKLELSLDTTSLQSALTAIHSKLRDHSSHFDRLEPLEQRQQALIKFMNEMKLNLQTQRALAGVPSSSKHRSPAPQVLQGLLLGAEEPPPPVALFEGDEEDSDGEGAKDAAALPADPATPVGGGRKRGNRRRSTSVQDEEIIETVVKNQKEVVGLRSLVTQLRNDQDTEAAAFMDYDSRLQNLKMDLMKLKTDFSSAFTTKDWKKLMASMETKTGELKADVFKGQEILKDELKDEYGESLKMLTSWLEEHDALATERQKKMDGRIQTCARTDELAALRENLENDSKTMGDKLKKATRDLRRAVENIRVMKEKKALVELNNMFRKVMRTYFGKAFLTWKGMFLAHRRQLELDQIRNNKTRKVLVMIMCRVLKVAFGTWTKYSLLAEEHRKEQKRALRMMTRVMGRFLLAPVEAGFKHWHRITLIVREEKFREDERENQSRLRKRATTAVLDIGNEQVTSLGSIMNSFSNDTKGAIDVLTREVYDLRHNELGNLRREWQAERDKNAHNSKATLDNALEAIGARAKKFEEEMGSKIKMMAEAIPSMRADLAAQGRSLDDLKGSHEKLQDGFKKHGTDIDSLFENQGRHEQRMFECEDGVAKNNTKIKGLDDKTDKTNREVGKLADKVDDLIEENMGLRQQLSDTTSYFEGELRKMRSLIEGNTERVDTIESAVDSERGYVRGLESEVNGDIRELRRIVEHPGVIKPPMSRMIDACLPFEQLSYAKKYCPPINSPDLDNIPDTIAAFGVDMAEWIAFKADHEALSRVIAGVNPEELVYADDDIELRRKSLLQEVKREFDTLMEIREPEAGALRLEARHKFVARMMDAIDSALSKHDQVLITGSSRASRIKASVPACVACDRPLRTKARKGKLMEEEAKWGGGPAVDGGGRGLRGQEGNMGMTGSNRVKAKEGGGNQRPSTADASKRAEKGQQRDASEGGFVGGRSGRAAEVEAEVGTPYVLRGGFKMPRTGKLTPMGETQQQRPYSPPDITMTATVAYGEREEKDDRVSVPRPQSAKR
ncbi:hypothetical protein TeGR_g11933 [Tetraparma gracilis]|uniref:Uncharacterized protein n=1 Tax=Tetraparma gracilis TaxID=2962635 RepID=A0ABQ6ND53_9STRA|nr:hypothetical protein TeGR_g11933 [Tetraparma gracilis]